jgi:hypothetical protein
MRMLAPVRPRGLLAMRYARAQGHARAAAHNAWPTGRAGMRVHARAACWPCVMRASPRVPARAGVFCAYARDANKNGHKNIMFITKVYIIILTRSKPKNVVLCVFM